MKPLSAILALGLTGVACSLTVEPPPPSTDPVVTSTMPTTTTEAPLPTSSAGEQIPGMSLWALVEGNDLDADRINLVLAPWGWDNHSDFLHFVSGVMSWSGDAYLIDETGWPTESSTAAFGAWLGLFAIEPWRSSRDKFNVWYTDVEPETPVAWLNEGDDPFQLTDEAVVTVALDAHVFNPDLTSVSGLDVFFAGPGPPERPLTDDPFSNSVVVIDSSYPAEGAVHIPHELGHALFNLADEYVGEELGFDGRLDLSSWPTCAEDLEEANVWGGDLTGDVDDMVDIWADEMADAGFPLQDLNAWEEDVAVGAIDGGCYAVPGSVRATRDSLMNRNIPVFGSINRRWAEQILDLWEGQPR